MCSVKQTEEGQATGYFWIVKQIYTDVTQRHAVWKKQFKTRGRGDVYAAIFLVEL